MLKDKRKVIVIIPAYNEEKNIEKALSDMPKIVDVTLVIDDGSTDKTAQIAKKNKANFISLKKHKNLDTALRTGFAYALKNGFDIITIMAGNGKDDPRQIVKLLRPIEVEDYDFVQGSRYLRGGKYANHPLHRLAGTRLYPSLLRIFTGFPATDGTNGFRAFKAKLLRDKRINLYQKWLGRTGMEFYLALKVIKLGYRLKEVPVSKIYPLTKKGENYTKVIPIIDWWNILKPLIYLTLGIKS